MHSCVGYGNDKIHGRNLRGEGIEILQLINLFIVNDFNTGFDLKCISLDSGITILQIDKPHLLRLQQCPPII